MSQPASHLLLVEGVPTAGKSTLIDALVRDHVSRAPIRGIGTLLNLTQDHVGGPLNPREDAGTLTRQEILAHLRTIGGYLSWLVEAAVEGEMPQPFIVVDTLHLTNCARCALDWEDVAALDARLAGLGGRLLLLTVSPETLWRRLFEGTERAAFREGYARRFGRTAEDIFRYFLGEQERMQALYEMSALRKWTIDGDQPLERYRAMVRALWVGSEPGGHGLPGGGGLQPSV